MSPVQQVLHRTAAGLVSQYNPVNQAPEGAQLEAENCVIDREGVISLRRGFDRYGTAFTNPIAMGEFKDKLVVLDGTTMKYNNTGTSFASWSGSFSAPDANNRVRFSEIRGNIYFTTSTGIKKNDELANNPVAAGIQQGLDIQATLDGTGAGWLNAGNQVGYRILWTREDASMYFLQGAPSFREVVTNANGSVVMDWAGGVAHVEHTAHGFTTGNSVTISAAADADYDGTYTITSLGANDYSFVLTAVPEDKTDVAASAGKAFNVQLVFTVPDDIVANDKWEVYRTSVSGSASTDPGDRHFKVAEGTYTAGVTVTYTDDRNESFLGVELYTNDTQETLAESNDRPPFCTDFTVWQGYPWYANTKREHELPIDITDLTGMSGGTLTFTDPARVYTGAATEDIAAQEFKVHSDQPTTAQDIEQTAKSLIRVINRDTGQTELYAYYISGVNDPPGKILIRKRDLNQNSFTLVASGGLGDNFTPDITSAVTSDDDAKFNNLQFGKFEQIEASPRLSGAAPIGSEKYKIVRLLPLRDSLIVMKEEGIWRVSGESATSFVVKQLDPSTRILAPESAVVLDNAVYALTNQGVVRVSESGTAIVSRAIENDFKKTFGFANFETITHAVTYETDRKYILFTQETSSDTEAKVAWVYDFITKAWTLWRKTIKAAHVLFNDRKLYMIRDDDNFILQERKSFGLSNDDYRDESHTTAVVAKTTRVVNGVSQTVADITFPASVLTSTDTNAARGWLFEQGTLQASITHSVHISGEKYGVIFDEMMVMDKVTAAACTVSEPIHARVRWAPEDMGSPALMKQVSTVQFYNQDTNSIHNMMGFSSDILNAEKVYDVEIVPLTGWGLSGWGDAGWGDHEPQASTPLRMITPRDYQRCRTLSVVFKHSFAKEKFNILNVAYTYRVIGERTTRQSV